MTALLVKWIDNPHLEKVFILFSNFTGEMANTDIIAQALSIHQILERIFHCMDLPTLKKMRLVCSQWGVEAARKMCPVLIIWPKNAHLLPAVGNFVVKYRVRHTLSLSLLNIPLNSITSFLEKDFTTDFADEDEWSQGIPEMFPYLQNTAPFLQELRVQLILCDEQDGLTFLHILSSLPNYLKRLCIELIDLKDEGLSQDVLQDKHNVYLRGKKVQVLWVRMHRSVTYRGEDSFEIIDEPAPLSPSTYHNFLQVFAQMGVEFLQLECVKGTSFTDHCQIHTQKCVQALEDFPVVKGLKIEVSSKRNDPLTPLLISLTHKLSHLSLVAFSETDPVKVSSILQRHASTLQEFNLTHVMSWYAEDYVSIRGELPYLPELTTLGLVLTSTLVKDDYFGPWTLDMLDPYCLRKLFLAGGTLLRKLLPALTHLSVLLPFEEGSSIWEYIFPQELTLGGIKGITYLHITLQDECDSRRVQKVYAKFPSLKVFKHRKRLAENRSVECTHTTVSAHETLRREEEEQSHPRVASNSSLIHMHNLKKYCQLKSSVFTWA